ncbi:hypothetical protein BN975_03561 [Mycolicibacterium farcinogenes]|nr:hypothetical protein BN975_03561 [Mycolicibacterium farcinogenes]
MLAASAPSGSVPSSSTYSALSSRIRSATVSSVGCPLPPPASTRRSSPIICVSDSSYSRSRQTSGVSHAVSTRTVRSSRDCPVNSCSAAFISIRAATASPDCASAEISPHRASISRSRASSMGANRRPAANSSICTAARHCRAASACAPTESASRAASVAKPAAAREVSAVAAATAWCARAAGSTERPGARSSSSAAACNRDRRSFEVSS